MNNVGRVGIAVAFVVACALAGCGGGSTTAPAVATATPTPPAAAAYLVYPPSGPYAVQADEPISIVFATSGLNASYVVTIAPTPNPAASSFPLDLSPRSLPSPLGSPPPNAMGPLTYATANLTTSFGGSIIFQPVTTYTVSLVGPTQTITAGTFQTNCGLPIPTPPPTGQLVYPANGATNVSPAIGELIFQGSGLQNSEFFGPESVVMTSGSGAVVPVGAFSAPASPLPSPLPNSGLPYVAAPVPALAAATTYTLRLDYADWNNTPPSCVHTASLALGSFTTQ